MLKRIEMLLVAVSTVSTVSTASTVAVAQDLKPAQEEAKAKFDAELEKSMKALNEACGTSAAVKTDFQNFVKDDWKGKSVAVWCDNAVKGVTTLCKSRPAYKKAIEKSLKSFECSFAGVPLEQKGESSNEYTKRHMSFTAGVFAVKVNPKHTSNIDAMAQAVMEKALN